MRDPITKKIYRSQTAYISIMSDQSEKQTATQQAVDLANSNDFLSSWPLSDEETKESNRKSQKMGRQRII